MYSAPYAPATGKSGHMVRLTEWRKFCEWRNPAFHIAHRAYTSPEARRNAIQSFRARGFNVFVCYHEAAIGHPYGLQYGMSLTTKGVSIQ